MCAGEIVCKHLAAAKGSLDAVVSVLRCSKGLETLLNCVVA